MQYLELTLPEAEGNLALDEALLQEAEAAGPEEHPGVLRVWENPSPAVIIGRSSRWLQEVDVTYCRQHGVPVLRRCSGGAAVVIGPGCLMYAVVVPYHEQASLRMLDHAHQWVLARVEAALRPLVTGVNAEGTSDLAWRGRKFSGNSLRCQRDYFLYHGTLLYDFPLDLIGRCLRTPPRQPEYRAGRTHVEFVTNLPVPAEAIKAGLRSAWRAATLRNEWPRQSVERLIRERYGREDWHHAR